MAFHLVEKYDSVWLVLFGEFYNEKSECHKSKVQGQSAKKWETEINWNLVCLTLKAHIHNFNNVFVHKLEVGFRKILGDVLLCHYKNN